MAASTASKQSVTIEYCVTKRKGTVQVQGSWDNFEKLTTLQYKGRRRYAVELELPLGGYLYRFLVDQEDWDTDEKSQARSQNGNRYNVLSVEAEGSQSSSSKPRKRGNRRGQQSMEIQLSADFMKDAVTSFTPGVGTIGEEPAGGGDDTTQRKSKRKRRKRQKRGGRNADFGDVNLAELFKQKDDEWARLMFSQQLKLQQEHETEIQRTKALWKQERAVRVDLHKKVTHKSNMLDDECEDLKKKIKMAEQRLTITQTEQQSSADKLRRLKQKQTKLQDEQEVKIRVLEDGKSKAEKQLSAATKKLRVTKSAKEEAESTLKSLQNQVSLLQQQAAAANAAVEQEKFDEINAQLEQLQKEKRQADSRLQSLQQDLKVATAEQGSSREQLQSLQLQVKKATSEKSAVESQMANQRETYESQIAATKSSHEKSLSSLKASSSGNQQALATQLEQLSSDIQERDEKISSLSGSASKYESELKSAQVRIQDMTTQLESTGRTLKNKERALADLQDTSQRTGSDLQSVKAELDSQTKQNNSNKAKVKDLTQQLTHKTQTGDDLQGQVDQLRKARRENEETINEQQTKLEELASAGKQTVRELKTKIAGLETLANSKTDEADEQATKIKHLEGELKVLTDHGLSEARRIEQRARAMDAKDEAVRQKCQQLFNQSKVLRGHFSDIKKAQDNAMSKINRFFPNISQLWRETSDYYEGLMEDLLKKYKRELAERRKYFNTVQLLRGNIRVFCRCRPLLPFELEKGYKSCVKFPDEEMIQITDSVTKRPYKFKFDEVFDLESVQKDVTRHTTEYVQSSMDGYNVSIFAYGQTGSGKTFTMDGPEDCEDLALKGVNFNALKELFALRERRAPMWEYTINMSVLEIYNGKIHDLLDEQAASIRKKTGKYPKRHNIVERFGEVVPEGLTIEPVNDENDILVLVTRAKGNRSMASTDMNAHSSRSHMVLIIECQGLNQSNNDSCKGKLFLVDLAGSERLKKTKLTDKARLREAQAINASLSALGNVFHALQTKAKMVPYRDSTLTRLMQNALGGNAKTIMFVNINPAEEHSKETIQALNFATRVAKVELGQAKANTQKGNKGKGRQS